jgi:HIP---CoA ligase
MTDQSRARTIPDAVVEAGERFPDRLALDDGIRPLTFAELARTVLAGATALAPLERGERVAVWGGNSAAWMTASLSVLATGATVVPVNHRYRLAETSDILTRAGCRTVLADGEVGDRDLATEAATVPGVDRVIVLDGATGGREAWTDLLTSGTPAAGAVRDRIAGVTPDDISHVQFTSGTTGRPKGAQLTHGAMVGTTKTWVSVVGLGPGDGYPVVAPFSHIGGHKTGIVASLISGATLRPMRALDANQLLTLLAADQATLLQGPPALFSTLVGEVVRQGIVVTSARVAVVGAAVVPPTLVREIYDVLGVELVVNAYGLTETTGVCTMARRGDPVAVVAETCGRPIDGVRVRTVGPAGEVLSTGQAGEVEVSGSNVMVGYLDEPEATAAAFHDGWLRTGDVGVIDAAGNLSIVDRLKDLVVVGGLNVYPAEIERVLSEHPAVDQVAVVGRPDATMGEVPVAFVVPSAHPGPSIDGAELRAFGEARLAGFKVPRHYVSVDALPINAAGKIDKVALRARL